MENNGKGIILGNDYQSAWYDSYPGEHRSDHYQYFADIQKR